MNKQPVFGTRSGFALVVIGLLLPFVFLPLCSGWIRGDGIPTNISRMVIPLKERKDAPVFRLLKKGEEDASKQRIQFEETGLFMEFDMNAPMQEIRRAVKARFPENKVLPGDPDSGTVRYEGWSVREAVAFPFRYLLAIGIVLELIGLWLVRRGVNARVSTGMN